MLELARQNGLFTSPTGDGFVGDDLDGHMPIMEASPGTFHQLPNALTSSHLIHSIQIMNLTFP